MQQQQYDKSAEAMDEEVIQGSRRRRRSPPQRTVRVGGGCNLLLQTVFVATLVAVVLGFVIHSFIFGFGGFTGRHVRPIEVHRPIGRLVMRAPEERLKRGGGLRLLHLQMV